MYRIDKSCLRTAFWGCGGCQWSHECFVHAASYTVHHSDTTTVSDCALLALSYPTQLSRLTTPSTLRVPLRIACCFAQTDSRAKLGRLHNSQCGSTAQAVGLSRPNTLTSNRSDRRKCDGRAQDGGARVTESNKAPSPTTIKRFVLVYYQ